MLSHKIINDIDKLARVFEKSMKDIEKNLSMLPENKRYLVHSSVNEIKESLKGKKDINEVINNIKQNADSI